MSYLDRLQAKIGANRLPTELTKPTKPGSVSFVREAGGALSRTDRYADALPPEITAGIQRLQSQPAPRITRPDIWPIIVADAVRLAESGQADEALGLGWHPLELFGCSSDPEGDDYLLGLAGWVNGRRPVLIDATGAVARSGDQRFCFWRKRSHEGATFLWDYGR